MVIIINIIFQVYLQYRKEGLTKYIASVFFCSSTSDGKGFGDGARGHSREEHQPRLTAGNVGEDVPDEGDNLCDGRQNGEDGALKLNRCLELVLEQQMVTAVPPWQSTASL